MSDVARYENSDHVDAYVAYWAPYLEKLSALLIDAMRAPDLICGKDVVVLGAGIGGFTAQVVALRPKSLVAVEPSTLMSDRIDRAGGLVVVENCQAQSMRIGGDGAFDTVCIAFMLQELDLADMNDVVVNVARLAKPLVVLPQDDVALRPESISCSAVTSYPLHVVLLLGDCGDDIAAYERFGGEAEQSIDALLAALPRHDFGRHFERKVKQSVGR